MNPELLIKCGKTLFPGKSWKSDFARAIGYDKQTVRRWADGDYPVPADAQHKIFNLVALHLAALKNLAKEKENGDV